MHYNTDYADYYTQKGIIWWESVILYAKKYKKAQHRNARLYTKLNLQLKHWGYKYREFLNTWSLMCCTQRQGGGRSEGERANKRQGGCEFWFLDWDSKFPCLFHVERRRAVGSRSVCLGRCECFTWNIRAITMLK